MLKIALAFTSSDGSPFNPQKWSALTQAQFLKAERLAFQDFAKAYESKMIRERMSGQRGSQGVNRVTGRLIRSFRVTVAQDGSKDNATVFMRVSFSAPYAAIHEFGGTVTRKASHVRGHLVSRNGATFYRGSHSRRGSSARYQARLGARETLNAMVPELGNMITKRLKDALKANG